MKEGILMHFYGTIGPACASAGTLRRLVDAGMTGLRMNLSHGALAEHADWLAMIHAVGIPDLLIDLQGPELRVGRLASPVTLPEGGTVQLGAGGIPCPVQLVQAARPGQLLLLDDGKLLVEVTAAGPDALVCTVLRGGVLQSRKSIAAPGLSVPMPTLTSEDLANLRIAASCGVTGVMLPFVRGKQDILALRQALAEAGAPQIRIFAKIENLAGVQALPEFLSLVDEVVIARGDLGNAMPLDMVDTCLCMGAGVNMTQGIGKIEPDTTCFAFVGDSTFFASAITGMVNAVYNQANMTLVVLDNSTTAMTGHQPHPGTGKTMMGQVVDKVSIEDTLHGIGVKTVETVNPLHLQEAIDCVKRVAVQDGVKAIIFKSPCAVLIKSGKPTQIEESKCIQCKKCIRTLGCPAIMLQDGKVQIEQALCTGCGLCAQVCPTAAIGGACHA